MYEMRRVFCATSFDLEDERRAFEALLGEFNESEAMPRGVLFVPAFLVRMRDKRPYQDEVDSNIRDARYYLLALAGDWGPPERNFKRDYGLACRSKADPALPMRDVVLLVRRSADDPPPDPTLPAPASEFRAVDDFLSLSRALLTRWLNEAAA